MSNNLENILQCNQNAPKTCISNTNSCFETKHFLPPDCDVSGSYLLPNGTVVNRVNTYNDFLLSQNIVEPFQYHSCNINIANESYPCNTNVIPSSVYQCENGELSNKTKMWNELCGDCNQTQVSFNCEGNGSWYQCSATEHQAPMQAPQTTRAPMQAPQTTRAPMQAQTTRAPMQAQTTRSPMQAQTTRAPTTIM